MSKKQAPKDDEIKLEGSEQGMLIQELIEAANSNTFFASNTDHAKEDFITSYELQFKCSRKEAERIATKHIKVEKDGYLAFVP